MILFRLIGLFFDLLLSPLRLLRAGKIVRPGAWLSLTIDGPIRDVVSKPRFWQMRAQKAISLHSLNELVRYIAKDPRVKGLVVTIKSMSGGMASVTSLRSALERVRAAGKEVAVHLPMGGDTKEVYVATAANKILLGPTTQLAPLGFLSATRYVKSALDKAGVEPQVLACGEFKSAGETLMRDSMSPPQRAQLERLLDTFHGTVVDGIASGRNVSKERAAAIVDEAPYFGKAAVEAGLADDVAYDDEVADKLGIDPKRGQRGIVDAGSYLHRAKRPLFRKLRRPPVALVIPIHGAIAHAAGPFGGLSTDERTIRMLRAARHSSRVKGVILHIDSPGGSALASDLMHHEIVQLAREKPVVACMANVAASGGYYVAAPAACIVAQPTTVTGSIGVVAARLSLEPLLARLGINTEVIERGKHATLLSPMGPLSEEDRATLMRELDATYKAFVGVVADGREMPAEEVERLARGRVYTGKDALDVGLVDKLGGFDVALDELKKLLDAKVRDRVEVFLAKPPRQPIPVLDPPRDDDDADQKNEDKKKQAIAFLTALLPQSTERLLLESFSDRNDRIFAIGPITQT